MLSAAGAQVQQDIVASLRMRDPLRLTASFNRPNIAYEARSARAPFSAPTSCGGAPG